MVVNIFMEHNTMFMTTVKQQDKNLRHNASVRPLHKLLRILPENSSS